MLSVSEGECNRVLLRTDRAAPGLAVSRAKGRVLKSERWQQCCCWHCIGCWNRDSFFWWKSKSCSVLRRHRRLPVLCVNPEVSKLCMMFTVKGCCCFPSYMNFQCLGSYDNNTLKLYPMLSWQQIQPHLLNLNWWTLCLESRAQLQNRVNMTIILTMCMSLIENLVLPWRNCTFLFNCLTSGTSKGKREFE